MPQQKFRISCGLDFPSVANITNSIKIAFDNRFDFVCIPLVHPRLKRDHLNNDVIRDGPFTRPDIVLKSEEWRTLIVGTISKHINADSNVPEFRKLSEFQLDQELDYASHLDIPVVLVPVKSLNCTNLARILFKKIIDYTHYQAWIHIPIQNPNLEVDNWRSDLENDLICNESTWEWWNRFRSLCDFGKKIGLALEITKTLPANEELEKWFAEPVKCIIINTSVFLSNKNGSPVLPKDHQNFIQKMSKYNVQVVITGNNHHSGYEIYHRYLNYLWQVYSQQQDPLTRLAEGMEEVLQIPLQPVTDNLSMMMCETFDRDMVKYKVYEEALVAALNDLSGSEEKEKIMRVMVLGTNRGSLVNVALNAAQKTGRKIKIYAVERNSNAVVTLNHHREEHWGDQVDIICKDVRDIKDLEEVDILVSELLGSFGDNELSPEIFDSAQKFLKENGISIPETHTSYISPVQNSKLYTEMKTRKEKNPLEKPYVVYQKNERIDNSRYKCLKFNVKTNCVLHGFSGYFDSTLYKNIKLSIVPENYSYGVISWFPIYFPLKKPVHVKAGDEITLHFWRMVGKTHVWYEWTISKPISLPMHNSNGECYKIALR